MAACDVSASRVIGFHPALRDQPAIRSDGRRPRWRKAPHRAWIEAEVAFGRSTVSLHQNPVDTVCFAHRYN